MCKNTPVPSAYKGLKVMAHVPPGSTVAPSGTESSHLDLVLLNILFSELEEKGKYTLLKSGDKTKLGSPATAFKGRTDI